MGWGGPRPSGPSPAGFPDEIGVPFVPFGGRWIRCAVAAPALPVDAPEIGPSGSSVRRRRTPRNSPPGCPGPRTTVTGSPGRRDRRRRACPGPPRWTPECRRVAARSLPGALRHAGSQGPGARGGRDRSAPHPSNQGSTSGPWPASSNRWTRPKSKAVRAAAQDTGPIPTAGRRRDRPAPGHPEGSEAVPPVRQRLVRVCLDSADLRPLVRAAGGILDEGVMAAWLPDRLLHRCASSTSAAAAAGCGVRRGSPGPSVVRPRGPWNPRMPGRGRDREEPPGRTRGDRTGEVVLLGKKIRDTVRCSWRSPLPLSREPQRGAACKRP